MPINLNENFDVHHFDKRCQQVPTKKPNGFLEFVLKWASTNADPKKKIAVTYFRQE